MCMFFSFVGDAAGNYHFFDWPARKQLLDRKMGENPDSHTYILDRCGIDVNRHHHWSKYEFNPLIKAFNVDEGVMGHDHAAAHRFALGLDFGLIAPALIIKPIVHPFKDVVPLKRITKGHIELVRQWDSVWDSVRASVWDSVWDSVRASVRDSVWDSVGAYTSSFFDIEYKHDFSPAIKLWEMGLVPSFDGTTWRLHGGPDARVMWKGKV